MSDEFSAHTETASHLSASASIQSSRDTALRVNAAAYQTPSEEKADSGHSLVPPELAAITDRVADPNRPAEALLAPAFGVLSGIEEQVRFADQKAAFLATLHSFLISALAGNIVYIRLLTRSWLPETLTLLGVCFAVYALLFVATMGLVALTVLPRIRRTARRPSKAFFGRIAATFADHPEGYIAELAGMSARDWLAEVGRYAVDASAIAVTKHRMARRATVLTIPTILAWLVTVLLLMFAGSAPVQVPGQSPVGAPGDRPPANLTLPTTGGR